MNNIDKKICIYGTGGSGRETLCCLIDKLEDSNKNINNAVCFMVDDEYYTNSRVMGVDVIKRSNFNPKIYDVIIAIGDPKVRRKIVESLPSETTYTTIIHPTATISDWVKIGKGTVITMGVILTCNIVIGNHSYININSSISHDCNIGDYFTASPAVNISGNCNIGENVFIGTNACLKNNISICSDTTIGMGAVVHKNIEESGVYVGNPAIRLIKK